MPSQRGAARRFSKRPANISPRARDWQWRAGGPRDWPAVSVTAINNAMFMPIRFASCALAAALIAAGCSGARPGAPPGPSPAPTPEPAGFTIREAPVEFTEVDVGVGAATDIEALIAPYRTQLEDQLAEVLGHATGEFRKADPEGTLDNLVADALLQVARELASDTVHAALVNEGGLRVPIAEGPILMRHAYELLPFENYVTVLSLSGTQMERLADEIAAADGEPIAGWTMRLDDDDAVGVLVGGEPIDPERTYRLATVDYLVNGGGTWTVLWEPGPAAREDLPILIRDAFVAYLRARGTVSPALDGRIRPVPGRPAPPGPAST
ncbi:MAG: hypothetical protein F4X00_05795, partial [Gemmatimonadetes bacterium]|nr:hypothetical protein [Gemmatimonadota bacterium]